MGVLGTSGLSRGALWSGYGVCGVPAGLGTLCHSPAVHSNRDSWGKALHKALILEKEMATQSSILAWRISWTEEPGGLQSMGHKESDTIE